MPWKLNEQTQWFFSDSCEIGANNISKCRAQSSWNVWCFLKKFKFVLVRSHLPNTTVIIHLTRENIYLACRKLLESLGAAIIKADCFFAGVSTKAKPTKICHLTRLKILLNSDGQNFTNLFLLLFVKCRYFTRFRISPTKPKKQFPVLLFYLQSARRNIFLPFFIKSTIVDVFSLNEQLWIYTIFWN